jgi:hypothetical protein
LDNATAVVVFVVEPGVWPGFEFFCGSLGGIFLVAIVLGSVLVEEDG